jgi:hypothetical protein
LIITKDEGDTTPDRVNPARGLITKTSSSPDCTSTGTPPGTFIWTAPSGGQYVSHPDEYPA